VRVFDFWYEEVTDARPSAVRRTVTCAAVPVGFRCSRLRIVPRDLLDGFADALSLPEVTVELEAFNRRFRVEAEDPRFASAFLDQRMIEALLRLPNEVRVDVNEQVLLLSAACLPPDRVLMLLHAAGALRRHLPRVLSSLFPARPSRGPHEDRWLQGRWSPAPIGADAPTSDEG
jgi:hypothetical protein